MSAMKLFVKLRESGEVKEVEDYDFDCGLRVGGYWQLFELGSDCYLCDEFGNELVPKPKIPSVEEIEIVLSENFRYWHDPHDHACVINAFLTGRL